MIGIEATVRAVALVVAVAFVGACGTELVPDDVLPGPDLQPVLGYWVPEDRPDAIGVQFSGCDAEPAIVVDETDQVVRVSIASGGGCEPLHHLVLRLDVPLGDRTVVDGSTGDPVREVRADGDP